MVMNVGMRPTMEDRGGLTVEVHVLHKFSSSFYGEPLRVIVSGFIRYRLLSLLQPEISACQMLKQIRLLLLGSN